MSRDDKSILLLALIALVFVFLMLAVGIWLAEDADAGQWVNIDQFKGLSTHTNGINPDMSISRYVDGWFVQNEGLSKPWFTKIRGNPVLTTPTYILGQNASSDRVLLFSDNFYSMTGGAIDPVGYARTPREDSAYTLSATDSVLYNWEDGHGTLADTSLRTASHWWLMWTLTTRSSVNWDSLDYPVAGFYSNRWILGRNSTQTVQARPMGFPISTPSVDEGSGTLELPVDTTLIFDGSYIWVYSGDADTILNSSTTTFTMPTYADTGRVINTYESGDTLVMVIDPPDSIYTQATEFWILWDDSLLSSHATPDSILSVIEYSTDSMRCIVLADTTKYKGANHYHGRQNGSGAKHMFYLLYKPGAATHYRRLGGSQSSPALSRDSIFYLGKVGPLHYAKWHTHAQDGTGIEDLDGFKSRTTDLNVWQLATDIGVSGDDDSAFCLLDSTATSSIGTAWRWFSFLIWDVDSIKASEWNAGTQGGNAKNNLFRRPQIGDSSATNQFGWKITTISTTTSADRFAVIHRQRSFASGNTHVNSTTDRRDSTLWVRYSRTIGPAPGDTSGAAVAKNYLTFPQYNKFMLEGNDPITGLSSLGQTLALYRRRGISLLTGFAPGDFFVQPAPVGQGAANHWCIARDPLTNQDVLTNENGIFYFGGGGLEPLSGDIVELFSDSINWSAESKIRAAVYDNKYFLTAPVGTDSINDKVIGLDLETRQAWTFTGFNVASAWNFKDDDGSEEMYFGDRDSTVLWQLDGTSSNLYFIPEWKSSWSDLGDADQVKRVLSHRIEVDAARFTDTVFIDWYVDLQDTVNYNDSLQQVPLWTDTVGLNVHEQEFLSRYPNSGTYPAGIAPWIQAQNLAEGRDTRRQTIQRRVPRSVAGKYLSFGLRGKSVGAAPLLITNFSFEYLPIGERRR